MALISSSLMVITALKVCWMTSSAWSAMPHRGALAVLHDTLPLTTITSAPQRPSGFYTGDGWKLLLCLRALRPDLHALTLLVAPSGLTLIAGLDLRLTVLLERLAGILESYESLSATGAVEQPDFVLASQDFNDFYSVRRPLEAADVQLHS
jgi:hypothetical protein